MVEDRPAYPTTSQRQRRQKRNTLETRNCKPRAPPQRAHSLPTRFSIGYPAPGDGSRLRIDDIEDEQPSHITPLDDDQIASGSCSPPLSIQSPVCTTPVHPSPLIGNTQVNPYLQRHLPYPPPPPPPPAYVPRRHIPRAPLLRPDAIVHFYKASVATNTHRRRWRTRFFLGHGGLPIDAIPLTHLCLRSANEAAVQRVSVGLKVLERLAPHIARRRFPDISLCEKTAMFGWEDVVPVHPRGSPAFDPVLGNIWCDSDGWIVAVTNPEIVFASESVYRRLERRFLDCRRQC